MNNIYPELTLARDDMTNQSDLYRPSSFWAEASGRIVEELCEKGIENFRSLPLPMGFFVPMYGVPTNGFSKMQAEGLQEWFERAYPEAKKATLALEQFLSGYSHALSEYRVLLSGDDANKLPDLSKFSESKAGNPVEQFEFGGRMFSRSSLNYLLGLAMLKKHLPKGEMPRVVLEIGGGFGTLGEIMASSGVKDFRYVDIDIPPTSYVAEWYLREAVGKDRVTGYCATKENEKISIEALTPLSVLCSWQIEKLQGQIDLFVNFISFQEMEPNIVGNYLSQVKRLGTKWILLRNIREGKQKKTTGHSLGVETPILGDDYIEMLSGYELVEWSVHPYGHQTVDGFHSELFLFRRA